MNDMPWQEIVVPKAPAAGEPRRRHRWLPVWRPAGVSIVSLVAIALVFFTAPTSSGEVLRDMAGNEVVADPGSVPTLTEVKQMGLVNDIGQRLQVPSVGLDVPLGEMNEVNGMVRPPGFTSAYMLRNRGVDLQHAADGTIYVAMHSVRDGKAPGNYLIDVARGEPTVKAGDIVQISNLVYHIQSAELIPKTELPSVSRLWTSDPGRLVLVTCLQRTAGRSLQNMVVVATLAG